MLGSMLTPLLARIRPRRRDTVRRDALDAALNYQAIAETTSRAHQFIREHYHELTSIMALRERLQTAGLDHACHMMVELPRSWGSELTAFWGLPVQISDIDFPRLILTPREGF